MTQLNIFQETCSRNLKKLLEDMGRKARSWDVVKGRKETYVEADIGDVKIWIYEDGACWQGHGRDRVFEAVDYDSQDQLQQAFIIEVATALTHGTINHDK